LTRLPDHNDSNDEISGLLLSNKYHSALLHPILTVSMIQEPLGFVVTMPFDVSLMVSYENNPQKQFGITTHIDMRKMMLLMLPW
jgi:hypothetical protein